MNKTAEFLNKNALKPIFTHDTKSDIEFAYDVFTNFVQVGMGGEWWSGKVKFGKNVLHHKKEKVDEGYKPVTVIIRTYGHGLAFDVMGGFYGKAGATFILSFQTI